MFTGIIEEIGEIISLKPQGEEMSLTIKAKRVLEDASLGCSIAVNGVCLTVTSLTDHSFTAHVMIESLRRTNLASLKAGAKVNLERALAANGRLGGHIVAGHVDGQGRVTKITTNGLSTVYTIAIDRELDPYIIYKGSVAINGISLTVASRTATAFTVSIIPHTSGETTLPLVKVGDMVNLETDIIGRYLYHFVKGGARDEEEKASKDKASHISKELLARHGFL